jgi:hypothetical protein
MTQQELEKLKEGLSLLALALEREIPVSQSREIHVRATAHASQARSLLAILECTSQVEAAV